MFGVVNRRMGLDDGGGEAEFDMNRGEDGSEDEKPVDSAFEAGEEEEVEAVVVTIDENGVPEARDSIADALSAVSAENAGISTFSAAPQARTGNIVVALDPGHDSSDAGARGNGLKEEELTLKIANYCKEELEQYDEVYVYMTRTSTD